MTVASHLFRHSKQLKNTSVLLRQDHAVLVRWFTHSTRSITSNGNDMLKHRHINNVFGENICVCKACSGSMSSTSTFTRSYKGVSSTKVLGCGVISPWFSRSFRSGGPLPQYEEDQVDPFSLVSDELSIVANRLRAMVVAEVPKLASAAEYFFKMGVEGKRFRPTVSLLLPFPRSLKHLLLVGFSNPIFRMTNCVYNST
ncbi:hypothetical protein SSX86_016021 [Deinandra increscens subsp. villosa]|uniref:Uncharacterized protein n=1 Tax=Deinandra increscens subsp. villosa TaxID=3103831 RepID=A0AAP0CXA5_9ASTR